MGTPLRVVHVHYHRRRGAVAQALYLGHEWLRAMCTPSIRVHCTSAHVGVDTLSAVADHVRWAGAHDVTFSFGKRIRPSLARELEFEFRGRSVLVAAANEVRAEPALTVGRIGSKLPASPTGGRMVLLVGSEHSLLRPKIWRAILSADARFACRISAREGDRTAQFDEIEVIGDPVNLAKVRHAYA